ncbi:hypothetical protein EYF80_039861 [Liparis tanakae]|uniref:Uncharacterized protein n=1 Tax=Liparis tanakae TaxID=230148 RepID=A0A4Z2GB26_9TELE|nr:hypothetical protein EYF80_039861 [Liparis tanakae]
MQQSAHLSVDEGNADHVVRATAARLVNHTQGIQYLLYGEWRPSNFLRSSLDMNPAHGERDEG